MYYNYQRILGSLGTTPVYKLCERIYGVPTSDEVYDAFDPTTERYRDRNYEFDQLVEEIKKSRVSQSLK